MSSRRANNSRPWLRSLPGGGAASTAPELTDEQLIDAVVRGDDRVAAVLYDRLVPVVDRTLYRVFGRRETDHDDLVQATFEQVVLTLTRRRFAGACSLATWASTVASHVGLNALRARRRERRVLDRGQDIEAPDSRRIGRGDVEHELGVRRDIEHVREHLIAMDPAKAQALFLHDVLGHELAEIAVLTGVSVAAAQSRLVRGRKDLHARIRTLGPKRTEGGES